MPGWSVGRRVRGPLSGHATPACTPSCCPLPTPSLSAPPLSSRPMFLQAPGTPWDSAFQTTMGMG